MDYRLPDQPKCVKRVWLRTTVSDTRTLNIGSPQGCVLSPWLFSLYTNCCTSSHESVKLIKFADDTTIIGLISDGDESAYRREVERLVSWCSNNNLELNAQKTVEMIMDFRRVKAPPSPLMLAGLSIPIVGSFCFLGTTITEDLKWEPTIRSLIRKAQQRMFFLRQLRKLRLPTKLLVEFYTAIIQSILTSSITVWYNSATSRDKSRLQHIDPETCRSDQSRPFSPWTWTVCSSSLWQEATVHPDRNLPSQEQLLSLGRQTVKFMNSLVVMLFYLFYLFFVALYSKALS
ncbi:uncharacterized protein LOC128754516 [Synchiropus splendidus]|uniref:uncharacterized protein LOC128754516 n=1 Tax=Synchiropus splendidus TaxID=270530 RepID=UPI00237DCF1B|nr:uncharacterized protein LOC128754516 [Synchiropus splendidus]